MMHHVLHDQRRHRGGFAEMDIADRGAPHLLAGVGIDGDGGVVQGDIENLAVGIARAAVHHVAAGDALRLRIGVRLDTSTSSGSRVWSGRRR